MSMRGNTAVSTNQKTLRVFIHRIHPQEPASWDAAWILSTRKLSSIIVFGKKTCFKVENVFSSHENVKWG